ncbi:VOC family protein [Nitrobacter sp. NHB1]|uniref:VOC family protein n=1 Tax=Nitrobacter sp. NHB1 TaxID=3119830 RepID=UPI002FFDEFFB
MTPAPRMTVRKLACFGLTTTNADRLAAFYERAFGFRRLAVGRLSGANFEKLMDVEGGATCIMLGLGQEVVELLEFDVPGEPYPKNRTSSDLTFQHLAIVVTNIAQAFQRLSTVGGWSAISRDGPQRLPESSGGVTAFKFRDPDGHPLELLAFPDGKAPARWKACSSSDICLGIDHSAICVSESDRSITFFESFGLRVSARSLNQGPEQERLDAVRNPSVEVTALSPNQQTPHIELLCYRSVVRGNGTVLRNNDIAATRLVLVTDRQPLADAGGELRQSVLDPDGHHLVIVSPGAAEWLSGVDPTNPATFDQVHQNGARM